MLRKCLKVTLAASLGLMAAVLSFGSASRADDKKDEKLPTISEIMKKGHKETDGYIDLIKAASKDGKWEDANKYAKTLAFFGESLGKNKPPRGEDDSWEKLTKKYAENTKLVLKGTEDKDAAEVTKGLSGIKCGECHSVHKPKK
jgi:hypothetical protein